MSITELTTEYIDNLAAGPEMDALVHGRALGRGIVRPGDPPIDVWGMVISDQYGTKIAPGIDGKMYYREDVVPDYSRDIAAAWQVVEQHPHYLWITHSNQVSRQHPRWPGPRRWICSFAAPEKFEAEADTAPLAICRAALKATIQQTD